MYKLDSKTEEKLKRQIEEWRDSFINTSPRSNNLLNQYPPKSNAIIFEVTPYFTYDKFWQIVSGHGEQDKKSGKLASYAIWSGNDYTDRRINPPIEWHAEKTGKKDLSLLNDIINRGTNSIVHKGENPICLSFGKLTWHIEKTERPGFSKEVDYGEVITREINGQKKEFIRISTPLILIPVKINRMGTNFWLKPVEEEDALFNPALVLRYQQEGYKMFPLPQDDPLLDKNTFNIKEYFEKLETHFSNNKSFVFDKNYVALDAFDYERICMYRDVLKHGEEIKNNKILRAFFGEDLPVANCVPQGIDKIDPLKSFQILDSDSSQNDVIERFANGESFILEGPPGTGKTQTIVNMIAEAIMRDKRVLFVSGKMSALNTVLKKLQLMPGVNIDKHCLLITGEEESKKINITDTYGKLKASLGAQQVSFDKHEYEENARKLSTVRRNLIGYNEEFYDDKNTLGMSIYDIIGRMLLLGYNENHVILVKFPQELIYGLTREELEKHVKIIGDLEKVLLGLIKRSGKIENDIWYGYKKFSIDPSDEAAIRAYSADMQHALEKLDGIFHSIETENESQLKKVVEALKAYPLLTVRAVCDKNVISDIESLYLKVDITDEKKCISREIKAAEQYKVHAGRYFAAMKKLPDERPEGIGELLSNTYTYANCKVGELKAEYGRLSSVEESILYLNSLRTPDRAKKSVKEIDEIIKNCRAVISLSESVAGLKEELLKTFDNGILDYDFKPLLDKFRTKWRENVKSNKSPLFFKGSIKELMTLCKDIANTDFTVAYVYDLLEKLSFLKDNHIMMRESVSAIAPYGLDELTPNALNTVCELMEEYLKERESNVSGLIGEDIDLHDYIVNKKYEISRLIEAAGLMGCGAEITVAELVSLNNDYAVIYAHNKRIKEDEELSRILPELQEGVKTDWQNIYNILVLVENLREVIHDEQRSLQADQDIFSQAVNGLVSHKFFESVNELIYKYTSFYGEEEWFENRTIDKHAFDSMTYNDFLNWQRQLEDINHVTEYVSYKVRTHDIEGTPEGEYFALYAKEGRAAYPIEKMRNNYEIALLHAYYSMLVKGSKYVSLMSGKDGVTTVKSVTEEYVEADTKAIDFNRAIVDRELYRKISHNSALHSYLASTPTGSNVSVRRLLKTRSESIKELAPCLMMSVYSVSKLLPYELYKFDVVIFDEASQIPTEDALTSIMRTDKQVVIAGDPKQMPAISYFESKRASVRFDEDDDEEEMGNCESIIDFVLNKKTNIVSYQKLNMHYRSNHESLISYSNRSPNLYNNKLITFPSPKPRTEDFGLWNYSLSEMPEYSSRLTGGGGQNECEAEMVISLLKKHIQKYPVPKTEEAIEKYHSVGVIVFGSKQKNLILQRMEDDSELKKLAAANDSRIFSIATADEIQGDEMSEMILSLTYGRDGEGNKSLAWGHMNQTDIALRKFNVAVTRARDNLKFVHSITSSEIDNDKLQYVADYLKQFVAASDCQFISDTSRNTAFIEAIGRICEEVVGKERVVYNFGENERSYRVPISILSSDGQKVVLGIMCERNRRSLSDSDGDDNGLSVREYSRSCNDILAHHGWNRLYETFAIQWIRNYSYEKTELIRKLESVKKL